jgi:hypothetical protein
MRQNDAHTKFAPTTIVRQFAKIDKERLYETGAE